MADESRAGFQGSRTTGVEVTLYSLGGDPVLKNAEGSLTFSGRSNQPDNAPSVVSISTNKSMGSAAGTFTVQLKAPSVMGLSQTDLSDRIVDDDWIDIVVNVNGKKTHVLRGQVSTIRWERSSQGGTPSRVYTITGKDFGGIFEKTFAWFNDFTLENQEGNATQAIWGANHTDAPFIIIDPAVAVRQALFGFLETLTGSGHPDWEMPPSMLAKAVAFVDAADFVANVSTEPERFAVNQSFINPSGAPLWNYAQQMSDPMFTELFCDLGDALGNGKQLDPAFDEIPVSGTQRTTMSVFYRDKPFVNLADGMSSPWFSLPMSVVPPQFVTRADLGRSGDERYTAFMVSPLVGNETFKKVMTIPAWDEDGISAHGMRQLSIESQYRATDERNTGLTKAQRTKVMNWHALNPYLLSGTIQLGALFPGIRIGTRLRISGGDEKTQETYYVEQVSHSWSMQSGGSTTVSVTRGWVGSDNDYLTRLKTAADRFKVLDVPGAEG